MESAENATYGPTESDATVRILGISSNLPASGIPSTSCWLTAWRRRLATPDIVQEIGRCYAIRLGVGLAKKVYPE